MLYILSLLSAEESELWSIENNHKSKRSHRINKIHRVFEEINHGIHEKMEVADMDVQGN
jgi:hypothetical protein